MTSKDVLPFPTEFTVPFKTSKAAVAECIDETLTGMPLRWNFHSASLEGLGFAKENVWSRGARRRRQQRDRESSSMAEAQARMKDVMDDGEDGDREAERVMLGFKIAIKHGNVIVRWLSGPDTVLWESFCGMLKRVVDGAKT